MKSGMYPLPGGRLPKQLVNWLTFPEQLPNQEITFSNTPTVNNATEGSGKHFQCTAKFKDCSKLILGKAWIGTVKEKNWSNQAFHYHLVLMMDDDFE